MADYYIIYNEEGSDNALFAPDEFYTLTGAKAYIESEARALATDCTRWVLFEVYENGNNEDGADVSVFSVWYDPTNRLWAHSKPNCGSPLNTYKSLKSAEAAAGYARAADLAESEQQLMEESFKQAERIGNAFKQLFK